jgi:hypothetical protein
LAAITTAAFYLWFIANTGNPFIPAIRLIAALAGTATLKTPWINILSAPEKRAKQANLRVLVGLTSKAI